MSVDDIRRDYRKHAESYDQHWYVFLKSVNDWVISHVDSCVHLVDLGCGSGLSIRNFLKIFPAARATGFDISPDMLRAARARTDKAKFHLQDVRDLSAVSAQIPDTFDTLLCLNVLHHLDDPDGFLCDLAAICRTDGKGDAAVFLCDFAIDSMFMKAAEIYWRCFLPSHCKAFSKRILKQKIEKHFIVEAQAVLVPDKFWRLQIYKLKVIS